MMKALLSTLSLIALACFNIFGQTLGAAKFEFEVVSIKAAAPSTSSYFHPAATLTGGPGSADPGMFRCTCNLASLIAKAFELQRYQLPGESSLPTGIFDVQAKIPEGTTSDQFSVMLQNLLKDRFGLVWHYDTKEMQGYELVIAKSGLKLQESPELASRPPSGSHDSHAGALAGTAQNFGHSGMMVFGSQARYRADRQTTEELAHEISNQIVKPVTDATGLKGKYNIALNWSVDVAPGQVEGSSGHEAGHGHGNTGGGSAVGSSPSGDAPGPTLFDALQSQLGLKLVASKKAAARILIMDHVDKTPTSN